MMLKTKGPYLLQTKTELLIEKIIWCLEFNCVLIQAGAVGETRDDATCLETHYPISLNFYVFKISLIKKITTWKKADNVIQKSQIMNTEVSFSYCLFLWLLKREITDLLKSVYKVGLPRWH